MNGESNQSAPLDEMYISGYEIISLLGEGGFSKVYEAKQDSTNQRVAIKVLKLGAELDVKKKQKQIARFERETQLCAGISHPHIVRLMDKGLTKDHNPFAVFEYVEGDTLKEFIAKQCMNSATLAGELMGQVLDALTCAHARGIVHRDLKPQNIMITKTGSRYHAKVLDFGVGTFVNNHQSSDFIHLTMTSETVGTPSYCSPEQLRGELPTTKTDIYAWGLVFVECLIGKPVMAGESIAEVYHKQLNGDKVTLPPSILKHPIYFLLKRVLDKSPENRPSDTQRLYDEFSKINLSNLVGVTTSTEKVPDIPQGAYQTAENTVRFYTNTTEKREITVVCCKFDFVLDSVEEPDLEHIDLIQSELSYLCTEKIEQLGGYAVGALGDNLMYYFGYPDVTDSDIRKAAKAAIDLKTYFYANAGVFNEKYQASIAIQIGLHTGYVLLRPNSVPDGIAPKIALSIMNSSEFGDISVSDSTKKQLETYYTFKPSSTLKAVGVTTPIKTFKLIGSVQQENKKETNYQFVGRTEELEAIHLHWMNVQLGLPQTLYIEGTAGVGKTKLTNEFKRTLDYDGINYYEFTCFPENQNNALYPFLQFFSSRPEVSKYTTFTDYLEDQIKVSGGLLHDELPLLCSWYNLPIPPKYTVAVKPVEEQKKVLFAAISRMLLYSSSGNKCVFFVEDFHWTDPTSIEFISYFKEQAEAKSIFFFVTSRPIKTNTLTLSFTKEIRLKSLSTTHILELIESILNAQVSPDVFGYIKKQSDGIPLFIEELTKMLLESKQIERKENQYEFVDVMENSQVPITLRSLLNTRLNQLRFGKETAQIASVIGREFSKQLLIESSLNDASIVEADLHELLQSDLVIKTSSEDLFMFRHALLQDAAYDSMLARQRKTIHLRIATLLENKHTLHEIPRDHLTALARHYEGAEEYKKAILLWMDIGEQSLKVNACIESCQQLFRALKLCNRHFKKDEHLEFDIRSKLGQSLIGQYGWSSKEVEENALITFQLAERHKITLSLMDYWTEFTSALVLHDFHRSESIITIFSKIKSSKLKDFIYEMMLATTEFYQGFHRSSKARFETVFKMFEHNGSPFLEEVTPEMIILPYMHQAWNFFFLGDEKMAHQYMKQGFEVSEGDVFKTLYSNAFYGIMCFYTLDSSKFETFVVKNYELGQHVGFNVLTVIANMLMGQHLINTGSLEDGLKLMAENVDKLDEVRHRLFAGTYNLKLAEIHIELGSDDSVITHFLDRSYTLVHTEYGNYFKSEFYRVKSLYLNSKAKKEEAERCLNEGLEHAIKMYKEHGGSKWFVERLQNIDVHSKKIKSNDHSLI